PVAQPPVTVEISRDGKAMHAAAFVSQASIEPASTEAGKWAPVNDEKSSAPAQPASPPSDQQNNKLAMAASGPSSRPQTVPPAASSNAAPAASSNATGEDLSAADKKTIDVDP